MPIRRLCSAIFDFRMKVKMQDDFTPVPILAKAVSMSPGADWQCSEGLTGTQSKKPGRNISGNKI
ncbi:MAG: hypothetical protein CSB23_04095 [Deltaproteobacteria bacterium]|nr:MAG: hypothetical protein CSB23_04095 [Deltaproteobacteria bacterium]